MALKITQQLIKTLRPPDSGNRRVYDSEIPGFGVRITEAGAISFVLNYRIHGRERRYTIGKYPELTAIAARNQALDLRRSIQENRDPLEERERDRSAPTLGQLASDYLERARKYKRSGSLRNDRGMLERIILPRFGSLRVLAIGRRDIETLHASLRSTPYHANRVLSLLSKMFSLAIERKWCFENPVKGVARFDEDRRERWLDIDELQRFIQALDTYRDQSSADALRLLLLTGAREQEVLGAEWPQFDLERGSWTRPSHSTKERRTEHVPLSESALALLRRMKAASGRERHLFPGRDGGARATVRRPWRQICKAAGLAEPYTAKGKRRLVTRYRPTLRIHDLRHSYASHLVSSGVSLPIVGKLLGHTQAATTQRYAHVADEAQRDATNRFSEIFKSASERSVQLKPRLIKKSS